MFSAITWQVLQDDPGLLEHARLAAAQLLTSLARNPAIKAALLAYNIMQIREGKAEPVLRDGVSGV